jgi:hypothetical protein
VGSKIISGIGNVLLFQNGKQVLTGSVGGRTSAYRVAQGNQVWIEWGRKEAKDRGRSYDSFPPRNVFVNSGLK